MSQIEEIELHSDLFLDRSTVFYGASKTGKSFCIQDALYLINAFVPQILVICPSDATNVTYSKKPTPIAPPPCIHYKLTDELLRKIWNRQEAHMAIYKRANNIDTLRGLYSRLCLNETNDLLQNIATKRNNTITAIQSENNGENEVIINDKIDDVNAKFDSLLTLVYKKFINEHRTRLSAMALSQDEMYSLKYCNFNPRIVLVFDDCSEAIKKFSKNEHLQYLFTKGRHYFITTLIACHGDNSLPPELKKNVFTTIFTSDKVAAAYFRKGANDFSEKEDRIMTQMARKSAFESGQEFQKLMYLREENQFYRFTAKRRNAFTFGNSIIRDFCKKIQVNGINMPTDNEFIGALLI